MLVDPEVESAGVVTLHHETSAKGKRYRGVFHFLLLLLITLFGGALRFVWLDRPPIWGDEAATFGRTCGTFAEMMDRLQSAGFAPVHYELYWWINQHTPLTPFMLRLVPAIAGTLMIPAMYWLAAQLIGRRAALLTALLVATSAYLLNYSRDAKMYSPFWLFAVINVASLLWWLRIRTPLSWCVWLASGTAMVGIDALGWLTVAIELLIVLTARGGNWLSLPRLFLLCICASAIGCLTIGIGVFGILIAAHGFIGTFRIIAIIVAAIGFLHAVWLPVQYYLSRRAARETEASETARPSHLILRILNWPSERALVRPWIAARVTAFRWPPIALFLLGLGIMLAGPFGYYYDFNRFLEHVDERGWTSTGLDWVQKYDLGRSGPSLIGFTSSAYLISWEWPREIDQDSVAPRTLRLLTTAVILIAAVLSISLLPIPWSSPRSTAPTGKASVEGWRCALWLALWIVLPAYGFYCVSVPKFVGPKSWLISAIAALHSPAAILLLIGFSLGWIWMAGTSWRARLINTLRFLAIAIATLLAVQAMFLIYPIINAAMTARSEGWHAHGSLWIPRYLAVILPAFLIVLTMMLCRLPTRPLRWGAIAFLVIVNLSVHGSRLLAGTEQPTPLMARDMLDSIHSDNGTGAFRAYFQPSMNGTGWEPGSIALRSIPMRYYLAILDNRKTHPNEVIDDNLQYRVRPGRFALPTFSDFIINDIHHSPKVNRFVTWERLSPGEVNLSNKPLDALAPGWHMARDQTFAVRDHWRWIDTAVLRRRDYVRIPTTQP